MDTERLEQLIESKNWIQLTEEEKNFVVQELGSEEQYTALRKVSLALVSIPKADLSPDPAIEKRLKAKFKVVNHATTASLWSPLFSFRMPALASFALIAVCSIAAWYVGTKSSNAKTIVQNVIHTTDTVYLSAISDTVIVEKVVYRYLVKPQDPKKIFSVVNQTAPAHSQDPVGVNMKEKEELDNFLVSGSN
jgi:hypothetical protein